MKTIKEVLENYNDYEVEISDRFATRFVLFLNKAQMQQLGFSLKNENTERTPKEWTRKNILEQLKKDVEFGWKKACDRRGISSSLMFQVVRSWNKILEEGLENFDDFGYYGKPLFKATAKKYGWDLEE